MLTEIVLTFRCLFLSYQHFILGVPEYPPCYGAIAMWNGLHETKQSKDLYCNFTEMIHICFGTSVYEWEAPSAILHILVCRKEEEPIDIWITSFDGADYWETLYIYI